MLLVVLSASVLTSLLTLPPAERSLRLFWRRCSTGSLLSQRCLAEGSQTKGNVAVLRLQVKERYRSEKL